MGWGAVMDRFRLVITTPGVFGPRLSRTSSRASPLDTSFPQSRPHAAPWGSDGARQPDAHGTTRSIGTPGTTDTPVHRGAVSFPSSHRGRTR